MEARKIRVVALYRHLDETRRQHAQQDLPFPAQHHAPTQFFDGENHACQRCVERRRQSACRTRRYQIVFLHPPEREIVFFTPAAPSRHHRRADLYRRPFAADGRAAHHADEGQRDFEQRLSERNQTGFVHPVGQRQRGQHLRNAAARRIRGETARQPRNQRQAQRQRHPCEPRILPDQPGVGFQRKVSHMCKQERHQRDQCRTGKQESEGGGFAGKAARLPEFVGDAQADKSWNRHVVVQIKRIGKGRLKIRLAGLSRINQVFRRPVGFAASSQPCGNSLPLLIIFSIFQIIMDA